MEPLPLLGGGKHPRIGFGTYKVGFIPASAASAVSGSEKAGATENAAEIVGKALKTGQYKFLDCAQFYGNEREVGDAIKSSGIPRSELFLASKVWTSTIGEGGEAVKRQVEKTLESLQTDYLDLYCVHWPVPTMHVEAYHALCELHAEGKIRHCGLSNYSIEDYEELMATNPAVPPSVNQIEINPFLYRKKTIEYFRGKGVVLQSYRSLRDGKEFQNEALLKIASKHGITAAQVLGRWCVQKDFVVSAPSAAFVIADCNRWWLSSSNVAAFTIPVAVTLSNLFFTFY